MTPHELEQQAFGRGVLMLAVACGFLYFGAAGWAIFCCVLGFACVLFSAHL